MNSREEIDLFLGQPGLADVSDEWQPRCERCGGYLNELTSRCRDCGVHRDDDEE